MLNEMVSIFTRCRATLLADAVGVLSLMALLVAALHLPDLF